MANDSLRNVPAAKDAKKLPAREILEKRLQELQDTTWNAQAVVKSVIWAICEKLDADCDPAHSLMRALRTADDLLEQAGSGLDSIIMFAPAAAHEVADE